VETGDVVASATTDYNRLNVEGIENVTTGATTDTITVTETEVTLNNTFNLGATATAALQDSVVYDFDAAANDLDSGHAVTIVVEAGTDTDQVVFTGPAIAESPIDSLINVENINIADADVANGATDALDTSNIAGGVVINISAANQTIGATLGATALNNVLLATGVASASAPMNEFVTITGIAGIEQFTGSALADRIILENRGADSMRGRIYSLGDGVDTIDLRTQNTAAVADTRVQLDGASDTAGSDYIFVEADHTTALAATDNRDVATSADTYVASAGANVSDNVIDTSAMDTAATITLSIEDQIADPNGTAVAAVGTYFRTEVKNADGTVTANFLGLGDTAAAGGIDDWNVILGGALGETVIITDDASADVHTLTLGGGANVVNAAAVDNAAGVNFVAGLITAGSQASTLVTAGVNQSITSDTNDLTVIGSTDAATGLGDQIDTQALDGAIAGAAVASTVAAEITLGATGSVVEIGLTNTGGIDATRSVRNTTTANQFEDAVAGDYNDKITGSAAANNIDGGAGNDVILGGGGNDTIDGGTGADRINGGAGLDTIDLDAAAGGSFVFISQATDSQAAGTGADIINNFASGTDKVVINTTDTAGIVQGTTAQQIGVAVTVNAATGGTGNDLRGVVVGLGADAAFGGGDDVIIDLDDITTFVGTDLIWRVDMTGGADAIDLDVVANMESAVQFVYNAQSDSTLGNRDTITDFDVTRGDTLDFRGFISNDIDGTPGTDAAETVEFRAVVSVDSAATLSDMFAANTDVNGANAGNGDVAIVIQKEGATSDYRVFVDVNGDGDFNQADDMVIDLVGVDNATDTSAGWAAAIVAGANSWGV
jgi:hypothetical protein